MAQQQPRVPVRGSMNHKATAGAGRHALEMVGTGERAEDDGAGATSTWACRGAAAGIAALGLAGGGVLVWWAVAFHPSHEQLWMVPVGLVLLGTPLVAWLSIFASDVCRRLGRIRGCADDPER